jgi:hypothetical protein
MDIMLIVLSMSLIFTSFSRSKIKVVFFFLFYFFPSSFNVISPCRFSFTYGSAFVKTKERNPFDMIRIFSEKLMSILHVNCVLSMAPSNILQR